MSVWRRGTIKEKLCSTCKDESMGRKHRNSLALRPIREQRGLYGQDTTFA
jgi:hypothetical protein